MPELPEAETIARELQRAIAGRTIGRVRVLRKDVLFGDPRPLGTVLKGRHVAAVRRRAKRVILHLGPDADLVFCLGMSGRLGVFAIEAPIEKHTHLRIAFTGHHDEVRFCDPRRFGGVWCLTTNPKYTGPRLAPLGPEPLELRLDAFRNIVSRRRQIKALLLDQQAIAGIGNIYCDESLHRAGIHPMTRADNLVGDRPGKLLRAVKAVLREAIRWNGSTLMSYRRTNGEEGSFQHRHRVYNRRGRPCKTCHTPIERAIVAGRSSFFCPACQPVQT